VGKQVSLQKTEQKQLAKKPVLRPEVEGLSSSEVKCLASFEVEGLSNSEVKCLASFEVEGLCSSEAKPLASFEVGVYLVPK
jgi:hypothetical protein